MFGQLSNKYRPNNIKPYYKYQTKNLIRKHFNSLPNSDIETTSIKVSLICPIGKSRIQYPVRPQTCSHIQCFDGVLYRKLNEQRIKWKCPICGHKALPENLSVDSLFVEILEKVSNLCEEIEFNRFGDWTEVSAPKPFNSEHMIYRENYTIVAKGFDLLQISSKREKIPIITIESSDEEEKEELVDVDSLWVEEDDYDY